LTRILFKGFVLSNAWSFSAHDSRIVCQPSLLPVLSG
jgi:hypothetical protein